MYRAVHDLAGRWTVEKKTTLRAAKPVHPVLQPSPKG